MKKSLAISFLSASALSACTQAYYEQSPEDRAHIELGSGDEKVKYESGAASALVAMMTLGMVGDAEYDAMQAQKQEEREAEEVLERLKELEENTRLEKITMTKEASLAKEDEIQDEASLDFAKGEAEEVYEELEEKAIEPIETLVVGQTKYDAVEELFGRPKYSIIRPGEGRETRFEIRPIRWKYVWFLREEASYAFMTFDKDDILLSFYEE